MKKLSCLLAAVLCVAILLTACSGSGGGTASNASGAPAGSSSTEPPKEDVTIRIMSWHGEENNSPYYKGYKEIADSYTKANPNVTFEFVYQPQDGYTQLLDTQFIAGSAADLVHMQRAMIATYANKGVLYNLTNDLNTTTPYNGDKVWIDTFSGGSGSFAQSRAANIFGGIFFVPSDENPLLSVGQPYIFNKNLFEQAGLDPEDTPETWSEFMEICKTLKDSGIIPVSADNDRWIFWSLGDVSGQFGEKYVDQFFNEKYNDDPDGVLFTDKVRICLANGKIADAPYYDDIFNIWKDFTQYWQDGWMGTTYDESRNLFVMQQAAMLKIGNWDHDYFKTTIGDNFEWGVFPTPSIDEKTSDKAMGQFKAPSGQQNYGFTVNGKIEEPGYEAKKETVIDFLKFMTSVDVQDKYVDTALSYSPVDGVHVPEELEGYLMPQDKTTATQILGGSFVDMGDGTTAKGLLQDFLSDRMDLATLKLRVAENSKKTSEDYLTTLLGPDGLEKQIADAETKLAELKEQDADPFAIDSQTETLEGLKLRFELVQENYS